MYALEIIQALNNKAVKDYKAREKEEKAYSRYYEKSRKRVKK